MAGRGTEMIEDPQTYSDLELKIITQAIATLHRRRLSREDFEQLLSMLGLNDALLQLRLRALGEV